MRLLARIFTLQTAPFSLTRLMLHIMSEFVLGVSYLNTYLHEGTVWTLQFESIDSITGRSTGCKWNEKFVIDWSPMGAEEEYTYLYWWRRILLREYWILCVFSWTSGGTGLPTTRPRQRCVYFYASRRIENKVRKTNISVIAFFFTSSALFSHTHTRTHTHAHTHTTPNISTTHRPIGRCGCVSLRRDIWGDWCRFSETVTKKEKKKKNVESVRQELCGRLCKYQHFSF